MATSIDRVLPMGNWNVICPRAFLICVTKNKRHQGQWAQFRVFSSSQHRKPYYRPRSWGPHAKLLWLHLKSFSPHLIIEGDAFGHSRTCFSMHRGAIDILGVSWWYISWYSQSQDRCLRWNLSDNQLYSLVLTTFVNRCYHSTFSIFWDGSGWHGEIKESDAELGYDRHGEPHELDAGIVKVW